MPEPVMPTRMPLHCYRNYHVHLRQLPEVQHLLLTLHRQAGCRGLRAMGNTLPPVTRVFGKNTAEYLTIQNYRDDTLEQAVRAGFNPSIDWFDFPLYASGATTPKMIEDGVRSGLLQAVKFYPPHIPGTKQATTNSHAAVSVFHHLTVGNYHAIRDTGIVACHHGETAIIEDTQQPYCAVHNPTALPDEFWFNDSQRNAEAYFYRQTAPRIIDAVPGLRFAAEHITTPAAVAFVKQLDTVFATVCPQHVAYTLGSLLRTLNTFLNCMPLVKALRDQLLLIDAITDPLNTRFGMGTDDAWHPLGSKMTACGCAAGCCTTLCAPQLYAKAFELWQTGFGVQDQAGPLWRFFQREFTAEMELFLKLPRNDLDTPEGQAVFENFLVHVGDRFHGLPTCPETFVMERTPQTYEPIWLDYAQKQRFMSLTGPVDVEGDWNIQLPIAMNWIKEGKDPETEKKKLFAVHDQRGTTAWSILQPAA